MKLLAILTDAHGTSACLDAAVIASRSLKEAEVEALHIEVDPDKLIAPIEEIDIQKLREASEGTADRRAQSIHEAFLDWASRTPDASAIRWKTMTGPEEKLVEREAAQADVIITVLSHETNMDAADALNAAIFDTGKPVLLVPRNWRGGMRYTFSHIAVGLGDDEAAGHAIAGARPWLRRTQQITAIRIGEQNETASERYRQLTSIAVASKLLVVPREEGPLGEQIVTQANAVGADLLVAGAYRHGQMIEWLFGSTTRNLIASANLPLLLAH